MSTSLEYFQMEAAERLDRLDTGLMTLERCRDDQTLISDLFREAHSLKGAASVSGLLDISEICHKMEDLLSTVRDGSRQVSELMVDALLSATGSVRKLVAAQTQQQNCDVDPATVIDRLTNLDRPGEVTVPNGNAAPAPPKAATPPLPAPKSLSVTAHGSDRRPATAPSEPNSAARAQGMAERAGTECLARDGGLCGQTNNPAAAAPVAERAHVRPHVPESDQPTHAHWSATGRGFATDTVRLRVDMLESLGDLTGELTVAGDRIRQRLDDVKQLHRLVGHQRSRHVDHPEIHGLLRPIAEELHRLADHISSDMTVLDPLIAGIHEHVLETRMLPLSVLFDSLPRYVRDYCRSEGKQVDLHVEGNQTRVDRQVLEQLRDPVIHLIRNAVSHGIESPAERQRLGKDPTGNVRLTISRRGPRIRITCEDDGRGIDPGQVLSKAVASGLIDESTATELSIDQIHKLLLEPGFSTAETITDVSGRGVGMDVVVSRLETLLGTLAIDSKPGQFARFVLEFPASMATLEGLLVESSGHTYIVPTMCVERTVRIALSDLQTGGGGELLFQLDGQAVPVAMLARLLGREGHGLQPFQRATRAGQTDPRRAPHGNRSPLRPISQNNPASSNRNPVPLHVLPAVVVRYGERLIAIGVDHLLDAHTIVVTRLGDHLGTVRGVAGATILASGRPALILDIEQLVQDGSTAWTQHEAPHAASDVEEETARLLIVDDSLTTRMMEKSILESAGYTVDLAVSAEDALVRIEASDYVLFVVDVEMPGMNGFELTRKLRRDVRFVETPIIIVTSLGSEQHRQEGLDSGANAYLVKDEFDQNNLLETVERLVGR